MSKTPDEKIVKTKEVPNFPAVKENPLCSLPPTGRPHSRGRTGDQNNNSRYVKSYSDLSKITKAAEEKEEVPAREVKSYTDLSKIMEAAEEKEEVPARDVKSYTDLSKITEAAEEKEEVPAPEVMVHPPKAISQDADHDTDSEACSFSEKVSDLEGALDSPTFADHPESGAKGPFVMVETKLHSPQAMNSLLKDMTKFEKQANSIRTEMADGEHLPVGMAPNYWIQSHKKLELFRKLAEKEVAQMAGNVKCKMCFKPSNLWCCYGVSYCSWDCFMNDPEGKAHTHFTVPTSLIPVSYHMYQMEENLRRQEAESRARDGPAVSPPIGSLIRGEKPKEC